MTTPQPVKIARLVIDQPNPFFNPNESLNAKSGRGFAAYTRIYQSRSAALVLEAPVDIPPGTNLRVELKHRSLHTRRVSIDCPSRTFGRV